MPRVFKALSRESASAKWRTDAVSAARMSERCWSWAVSMDRPRFTEFTASWSAVNSAYSAGEKRFGSEPLGESEDPRQ